MEDLILVRVMEREYAEKLRDSKELRVSTIGYYREHKPGKENVKNTYDTHESDIIYDSSYQDIVMTEDLREKSVKGEQGETIKIENKSDGSGASIIEIDAIDGIGLQDSVELTLERDSLHSYFISCWGIVENSNKAKSEYLSSMVNGDRKDKVLIECNLENLIAAFKGSDLGLIKHGKIKYDQQNRSNTKDDSELESLLHKRKQFEEQKEYRFILRKTSEKAIDSKTIILKDLDITLFPRRIDS